MQIKLAGLLLGFLLCISSSFSAERRSFILSNFATSFGVLGGIQETAVQTPSYFYSPIRFGYGGGAKFSVPLFWIFALDVNALLTRRIMHMQYPSATVKKVDVTVDAAGFQLPMILRARVLPWLALGVGGYYFLYVRRTVTAIDGDNNSTKLNATADDLKSFNFGTVASLALRIPASTAIGAIIDGRYYFSPFRRSHNRDQEIQGLLGVEWTISPKRR